MENDVPLFDELVHAAISDDTHSGGNDALDNLTIKMSGNGTAPQPANGPTTREQPRTRGRPVGSGKGTRKSKRDVEAELVSVQAELAAERARNNGAAVAELATQVEMAAYLLFGAIAVQRGPHWGMQPAEAANIGKAGALALAPHAEMLRRYSPWAMLAATLGGAVYTRIQEDRRLITLHGVATPDAL